MAEKYLLLQACEQGEAYDDIVAFSVPMSDRIAARLLKLMEHAASVACLAPEIQGLHIRAANYASMVDGGVSNEALEELDDGGSPLVEIEPQAVRMDYMTATVYRNHIVFASRERHSLVGYESDCLHRDLLEELLLD